MKTDLNQNKNISKESFMKVEQERHSQGLRVSAMIRKGAGADQPVDLDKPIFEDSDEDDMSKSKELSSKNSKQNQNVTYKINEIKLENKIPIGKDNNDEKMAMLTVEIQRLTEQNKSKQKEIDTMKYTIDDLKDELANKLSDNKELLQRCQDLVRDLEDRKTEYRQNTEQKEKEFHLIQKQMEETMSQLNLQITTLKQSTNIETLSLNNKFEETINNIRNQEQSKLRLLEENHIIQFEQITNKHKQEIQDIEGSIKKLNMDSNKRILQIEEVHALSIDSLKKTHMKAIEQIKNEDFENEKKNKQKYEKQIENLNEQIKLLKNLIKLFKMNLILIQQDKNYGDVSEQQDKISQLQDQIKELEKQKNRQNDEIRILKQKIQESNDRIQFSQTNIQSQETLSQRHLESDLKATENIKKIQILEEQIRDLTETIKDKNDLIVAKTNIIEEKNKMIQMNEILISENEELIQNNSEKISNMDDEIMEKDKKILSLQAELENVKKGFDKVIQQNSDQFMNYKKENLNQVDSLTNKMEEYVNQIDKKQNEISVLNYKLEEKVDQVRLLKDRNDLLDSELKYISEQSTKKSLEIERLTEQMKYVEIENSRYQQYLAQTQNERLSVKQEYEKDTSRLQDQMKQAMKQYLQKLEEKENEIKGQKSYVDNLVIQMNEQSQEISRKNLAIQSLNSDITKLKTSQKIYQERENIAVDKEKSFRDLTQLYTQSQKNEEALEQKIYGMEQKIYGMEQVIYNMNQELESLESQLKLANQQIEQMSYLRKYEASQQTAKTQPYQFQGSINQISKVNNVQPQQQAQLPNLNVNRQDSFGGSNNSNINTAGNANKVSNVNSANTVYNDNNAYNSNNPNNESLMQSSFTQKDANNDNIMLADLANEILTLIQNGGQNNLNSQQDILNKEGIMRQTSTFGSGTAGEFANSSQFVTLSVEEENAILYSLQKIKNVISQKLTQDLTVIQAKNTETSRAQLRKHLLIIIKVKTSSSFFNYQIKLKTKFKILVLKSFYLQKLQKKIDNLNNCIIQQYIYNFGQDQFEINLMNQNYGIDRWKKVRGGQGDKINKQTKAIDEFIQQFSRVLIALENKKNQNEISFVQYASSTYSHSEFMKAKQSSRVNELIKVMEYRGLPEIPPFFSQSKTSSEIQYQLKQIITEFVKSKKAVIASSIEITLVLMSTENTEQAMQKHILDFLQKIPDSETWKKTITLFLNRYSFACMQSKVPGSVLDKVSPISPINPLTYNFALVQDNSYLFY